MLDRLTAASLTFLPAIVQRRLLDALRHTTAPFVTAPSADDVERANRTAAPPLDSAWLHREVATAMPDAAAARTLVCRAQRQAEQALDDAQRTGMDTIVWGDASYPPLLAEIAHPPFLLWRLGDPAILLRPCIAIVGSRAASEYGLEVAARLAADLAASGLTIVSGLARGADSAAHRGALKTGRTAAILGSGLDIVYPPEHDRLAADIAQRGIVLSEFAPGTPPRPDHFPRRNRLISGLSLAVLVIEASERSGSLQTARFAAEQGREVMAVPGSVLGERHRGTHALLRDGAILIERAADVLLELRLGPMDEAGGAVSGRVGVDKAGEAGGGGAAAVLSAMRSGEAYDLQALVGATSRSAEALLRELLLLELEGRVARTGDGRFLRAGRPVIR